MSWLLLYMFLMLFYCCVVRSQRYRDLDPNSRAQSPRTPHPLSQLYLPPVDSGPVTHTPRAKRRRLVGNHPSFADGIPGITLQELKCWKQYDPAMRETLIRFLEERNEIQDILLRLLKLEIVLV